MLEWYRVGWTYQDLMAEVDRLVRGLLHGSAALRESEFIRYQDIFQQYCGLDPWSARQEDYRAVCTQADLFPVTQLSEEAYQALLLDQVIAARLPRDRLIFIYDFPVQQACLARISDQGRAERFELYAGNLELANGYQELTDADEHQRRFAADNSRRKQAGKEPLEMDVSLIAALRAGLPDCAGVALGVDRLLMLITGAADINELLACPD